MIFCTSHLYVLAFVCQFLAVLERKLLRNWFNRMQATDCGKNCDATLFLVTTSSITVTYIKDICKQTLLTFLPTRINDSRVPDLQVQRSLDPTFTHSSFTNINMENQVTSLCHSAPVSMVDCDQPQIQKLRGYNFGVNRDREV